MESLLAPVVGAVVSTVFGRIIGGSESSPSYAPPAAPVAEAATKIPIVGDEAAQEARKRSFAAQTARRGRASTILTSNLGSDSKLGA